MLPVGPVTDDVLLYAQCTADVISFLKCPQMLVIKLNAFKFFAAMSAHEKVLFSCNWLLFHMGFDMHMKPGSAVGHLIANGTRNSQPALLFQVSFTMSDVVVETFTC